MDDFDDWYRRLHPRLVTVLVSVVGDSDVATDAADEALVRALERWPAVSTMSSPDGVYVDGASRIDSFVGVRHRVRYRVRPGRSGNWWAASVCASVRRWCCGTSQD